MTSGDFDFFGAPTSPPPSAPPAPVNQFGMPMAVNQFGTPATVNQFGIPAGVPAPVLLPPVKDQTGRNVAVIGGLLAAVALLTGGLIFLQNLGHKTANNVATAVETPLVKAHQIVETSDLQQAQQAEAAYLAENSGYAASIGQLTGFRPSATDTVTVVSATATTFCLRADDPSTLGVPSMYLSSAANVASTTPCA